MPKEFELRFIERVTGKQQVNTNPQPPDSMAYFIPRYEEVDVKSRILQQYLNGQWIDVPLVKEDLYGQDR